jgi:hypothetical protein
MAEEIEDRQGSIAELATRDDGSDSPGLVEITAHIREDQAFALEILGNAERQRVGKGFNTSELIREALDLLIEKHIAVIDLRKNKLVKKGR